jgi:hypothetical protein
MVGRRTAALVAAALAACVLVGLGVVPGGPASPTATLLQGAPTASQFAAQLQASGERASAVLLQTALPRLPAASRLARRCAG